MKENYIHWFMRNPYLQTLIMHIPRGYDNTISRVLLDNALRYRISIQLTLLAGDDVRDSISPCQVNLRI